MRLLKNHPFLKLGNSYVIDSPQPSNLSYAWNFGSLLAVCLIIQIISGVTLAMHYNPSVMEAFNSVEHIMRDVNNGWFIRYLHSNTASAFFFLVYLHIGRGLYYGSYKAPRTLTWIIGTVMLVLMMAIGFLGYVDSPKWFNLFLFYLIFIFFYIIETKFFESKDNLSRSTYNIPIYLGKSNGIISNNNYIVKNISMYSKKHYSTYISDIENDNSSISLMKKNMNDLNLDPVFIFEDLHLKSVQSDMRNELKGLTGIYMIYNKITDMYYVGSASTNRFYRRFYCHMITGSCNKHLKNAVKKYKMENFAFIILELLPKITDTISNKDLLNLENSYLQLLLSEKSYNILLEAGNSYGYKHEDYTREIMINSYTEERRKAIGDLNRGKKFSSEVIAKIREAALSRKSMLEATKLKCITNTKPVVLYNKNGTVFGEYSTIVEAAKAIKCNDRTIRRALNTDSKLVKRTWRVESIEKKVPTLNFSPTKPLFKKFDIEINKDKSMFINNDKLA